MSLKYNMIGGAFQALSLSGLPGLVRAVSRCRGVIFTLHRVLPQPPADFSPNAILQITPKFLEQAIVEARRKGFEIVTMDEAVRRIDADEPGDPFVVFTFDDAYRDNLEYALPILRKHDCPFTLYVPTALVDGAGEVWWQALEDIIAVRKGLNFRNEGGEDYMEVRSLAQKKRAFAEIYERMRQMPEAERVELIKHLAWQAGLDLERHCRELIMDWRELTVFARDPLCTIGAHTVHHYELSKLSEEQARNEIEESANIISAQFGTRPAHLSYPIGSAVAAGPREYRLAEELGFVSAVTTRPGGLYKTHRDRLWNLPRISLNGNFQRRRYLDVFLTGAIFSAMGRG